MESPHQTELYAMTADSKHDTETFTTKVRRQRHPDFCGGGCAVRRDAV